MKRLALVVVAVASLLLLSVGPASAGGWAVSTLDSIPAPTAGEPVEVGFTIRQHGQTPVDVDDVAIVITGVGGGADLFAAEQEGAVGHYVAQVTLPADGRYRWSIRQGWFGDQALGEIELGPTDSGATAPGGDGHRWPAPIRFALPVLAVVLGLAVVADLARRPASRRRWSAAAG